MDQPTEIKIKKINLMGVAIDHNLIIPVSSTPRALLCKQMKG